MQEIIEIWHPNADKLWEHIVQITSDDTKRVYYTDGKKIGTSSVNADNTIDMDTVVFENQDLRNESCRVNDTKMKLSDNIEQYKVLLFRAAKIIDRVLPLPDDEESLKIRQTLLSDIKDLDSKRYRFEIG